MFAVEKIQEGLTGLVAVRQPQNPDIDRLDPAQYTSISGLYLDDVEHFRLDYWIDGQSFAQADDSELQTLWENLEKSTIANVMANVFNRPTYIDRNLIYSNTFDRNELITLPAGAVFYGYEINVSDKKNLAFNISRVIIEAQGVVGETLTVSLFHSSQATALHTKNIVLTDPASGVLQIDDLNWYVDNSGPYYKGTFFIGYTRPAFVFTPFARNFERADIANSISDLRIRRIEKSGGFASLEDIDYTDQHSGLNFDITVYNDYTDLILQNKFMFAKALQLQWAMSVLLMGISSNRSNRNERMSKDLVQILTLTIEGQSGFGLTRVTGLRSTLAGELNRLQSEVESIIKGYFTQQITMSTVC